MRILLVADPYLPVPPRLYGGIERVVAGLADGLQQAGHTVALAGAAGSTQPCDRLYPYGCPPHTGFHRRLRELLQLWRIVRKEGHRVDLVHSFGRLAGLLPVMGRSLPKVQTYQRAITPRSVRRAARLAGDSLHFTACSRWLWQHLQGAGSWHTVYNGVPGERYQPRLQVAPDAPLVFLGRLERIKGPHRAIEVARATGRSVILAGNVVESDGGRAYFDQEIRPCLEEPGVCYLGPVDDEEKDRLLGKAAALLMPIEWDEPFGIVMAEALACGAPVIGLNRGSVPEVVEDGVTGFVCDSPEQMMEAVGRLHQLDRGRCREAFERRFSSRAMVDGYTRVYEQALT